MAHRGGRVIDTDTLRISPLVQVSRDGQEREQDSEDNPNVNAHQSRPAATMPLKNLASRQYARNIFNGLMSRLITDLQWVRAVFRCR
jgi:TolB-like protein